MHSGRPCVGKLENRWWMTEPLALPKHAESCYFAVVFAGPSAFRISGNVYFFVSIWRLENLFPSQSK